MIYSKSKLGDEIKFIIITLCSNGFPLNFMQTVMKHKIFHFNKIYLASVQRCPVHLRLLWLGGISDRFVKQTSQAERKCYFSANVRVAFNTKPIAYSDIYPWRRSSAYHKKISLLFIYLIVLVVCAT